MIGRFVIGMGALALLSACAPSAMLLVGTARPPISAADVKIYDQPPASFEEVAILNAWSDTLSRPGGSKSAWKRG